MNRCLITMISLALMHTGCYEAVTKPKPAAKKTSFVYTETIAKGKDTGMVRLGAFKRINIADVLCQRWDLENRKDITASVIPDLDTRKSIVRDMVLFKDSTALLNPMGALTVARWRIRTQNKLKLLMLHLQDGARKEYIIEHISSSRMKLMMPGWPLLSLEFAASGELHQNMYNDPFHPSNNRWRIKPAHKETDSGIHERIKNCLLFYALYYRDHIKRQAETISFEGLPALFEWYNGGIGLPHKNELSDSWIECFYNKDQALKGYTLLRKLIVDYEFNWPKGAPNWLYRTHSVLEQMYYQVDELKAE